MVTPLPTIESDVLALLEGDFKLLQQAHEGLLETIRKHRDAIGGLRAHNWSDAIYLMNEQLRHLACDECQDAPYQLGLWPIGRGAWACDRHKAIIDARIESEHYRPEPKR